MAAHMDTLELAQEEYTVSLAVHQIDLEIHDILIKGLTMNTHDEIWKVQSTIVEKTEYDAEELEKVLFAKEKRAWAAEASVGHLRAKHLRAECLRKRITPGRA